jgi:hypothetical protein
MAKQRTMSDTPFDDSLAHQARIRERAYYLWQADGCPHGRADEYWERARELIGIEDSVGAGPLPNPQAGTEKIPGVVVDEAELEQNLGEFPGALTDQGDRPQTPAARKAPARRRTTRSKAATKPG